MTTPRIGEMDWTPLTDIYDTYSSEVESAEQDGVLDDPVAAEQIVWPSGLRIGELEREDIENYLRERVEEIIDHTEASGKILDLNLLYILFFRTLISGMLWEAQRLG